VVCCHSVWESNKERTLKKRSKRMLVVGSAALAVVGGGGAALAAGGNPFGGSTDRQAVLNDAAKRLNVKPSELQNALQQAILDQIDAAQKAGRLTQQQADALKARVKAGGGLALPFFGGPGLGFHHGGVPFAGLDAAAKYLGLTEDQLRTQLRSGKTLAQIAKAQGKSTDGLKQAMLAGAKQHLDADVKAGKLTQKQADQVLSDLSQRLDSLIQNGFPRFRVHDGDGDHHPFGFFGRPAGGFAGPPPTAPAAA
jgi:hypothetical protein